jgi:Uncharacterized conserved protein (DUF2285)/Family of unknown function (DUF6499)
LRACGPAIPTGGQRRTAFGTSNASTSLRLPARNSCPAGALAVINRPPLSVQTGSLARHDRADFAQEFLRRNAAYRAAWLRQMHAPDVPVSPDAARRWGLVQLFDPDRSVRSMPAIWHIDAASQVVPLAASPGDIPGAAVLPDLHRLADLLIGDKRHIVLDQRGVRHRLVVSGDSSEAQFVMMIGPRADSLRVAACDAARRLIAGVDAGSSASILRPTVLRRRRLSLLLHVLDASLAGASLRSIGTRIVYPWLGEIDALTWKTMSERRRVQRLIAGGSQSRRRRISQPAPALGATKFGNALWPLPPVRRPSPLRARDRNGPPAFAGSTTGEP